jgi:hypothetical protein
MALTLAIGAAGPGADPRGAGGPRGASLHRCLRLRLRLRALDTRSSRNPQGEHDLHEAGPEDLPGILHIQRRNQGTPSPPGSAATRTP